MHPLSSYNEAQIWECWDSRSVKPILDLALNMTVTLQKIRLGFRICDAELLGAALLWDGLSRLSRLRECNLLIQTDVESSTAVLLESFRG